MSLLSIWSRVEREAIFHPMKMRFHKCSLSTLRWKKPQKTTTTFQSFKFFFGKNRLPHHRGTLARQLRDSPGVWNSSRGRISTFTTSTVKWEYDFRRSTFTCWPTSDFLLCYLGPVPSASCSSLYSLPFLVFPFQGDLYKSRKRRWAKIVGICHLGKQSIQSMRLFWLPTTNPC